MSINRDKYFDIDGTVKPEALYENAWLKYLLSARDPYWNAERIEKMEDKQKNAALEYVLRTLDILDEIEGLTEEDYEWIRTVLSWSEVAKAGSPEDRSRWLKRGYPLEIHNEASALIYADHFHVRSAASDPVYILIKTHGLAGQYLRGECDMDGMKDLISITSREYMDQTRFSRIFESLNECIIKAVDPEIWTRVKSDIHEMGLRLYEGKLTALSPLVRLEALLPDSGHPDEKCKDFFSDNIFPKYDLWYFQSALEPFGFSAAYLLCREIMETLQAHPEIRHLNFKPLADAMYYDYEGKKHINTYKQRIIEKFLTDPAEYSQHVHLNLENSKYSLLIGVEFTPACEKLIDFCVEAERSGLLSYEKSITILYDIFGFRRDSFDRLNNEENYLQTMNDAEESTKLSILDHIVGDNIVDVGSGGGVLLDEIEKVYPEKCITGTDISQNVIETLERKKREEGHRWNAIRHNFVDDPLEFKADSIIFSSIIHEIYSYTDLGNGKFDQVSIERALKNAVLSLNDGGRIIIRDGVKTPGTGNMKICFKTSEGFAFFKQFLQDFRGMDHLEEEKKCAKIDSEHFSIITDINYGREFLYTYTWGAQSFPHEVQECFGYFTLDDFEKLFRSFGMKLEESRSLLEPGYKEHLDPLVDIFRIEDDGTAVPMEFPDSNCIVVAVRSK